MAIEGDGPHLGFENWERAAIQYWSTRVSDPVQQEDLRAELVRKLLLLKAAPRPGIRYPKAYVRAALANTAKTWLRKLRAWKQALRPEALPNPDAADDPAPQIVREAARDEGDFGIGVGQFWKQLDPRLQRFLTVLEKKNGNLSATAKALRIHRNTASLWRAQIQALVRKHELGP